MSTHAWERVLSQLKGQVSEQVFETWLRPLRYVSREGSLLLVATPHKFFKQWIEENFLPQLEDTARKEIGQDVSVEIVVGGDDEAEGERGSAPAPLQLEPHADDAGDRRRGRNGALNPRYTFDRFVVGAGNQFAHAAAFAVANDPARSYNPLFIYGGVGLGKTHLLHAIGNLAVDR
ncbi:MAG: DnaA ATPase domain-containing protein, partial [Deltaproteobacteria bacterium]